MTDEEIGPQADPQGHRMFLETHVKIYEQTAQEAGNLLAWARNCHAHWGATLCYLKQSGALRPGRAQPLWECATSGWSSVLLASTGYYREAWGTLRQEMDLVLWEWTFRRGTTDPTRPKTLLFQEGGGAGVRWNDVKRLFDLPEVADYRRWIEQACDTNELSQELLRPVDTTVISELRTQLHAAAHGDPGTWNLMSYPTFEPFPEFAADAFQDWAEAFADSQRAIATWCLLMFPELMRWSQTTSLEHCLNDPTKNHDVWLQPVLHPTQAEFFATWHPVGLPPE